MAKFRSADVVLHIPTQEIWVLAWADDKEVSPCGWPETSARAEDCVLEKAATDKEFREMVDLWAAKTHTLGGDFDGRIQKCKEIREGLLKAEKSNVDKNKA